MKIIVSFIALFVTVKTCAQDITAKPISIQQNVKWDNNFTPYRTMFRYDSTRFTNYVMRIEAGGDNYAYKNCDTCKWVIHGDIGKVLDVMFDHAESDNVNDNIRIKKWQAADEITWWFDNDGNVTDADKVLAAAKKYWKLKEDRIKCDHPEFHPRLKKCLACGRWL